jgi:hypothetical protein
MKCMRKEIAEANPGKNPRELMGDIAIAWKGISTTEKEKYNQMAVEDKLRYEDEKKTAE